jgi:hypothetical protein
LRRQKEKACERLSQEFIGRKVTYLGVVLGFVDCRSVAKEVVAQFMGTGKRSPWQWSQRRELTT